MNNKQMIDRRGSDNSNGLINKITTYIAFSLNCYDILIT